MKRTAIVVAVCLVYATFVAAAQAQRNSMTELVDSPIKVDSEVYNVGGGVICSLSLPGTAALFGVDTLTGTAAPVLSYCGELFGSFRVWEFDENCVATATWSTAFAGGTMTGIASPNGDISKYWAINPLGSADEYDYGVGTATGVTVPLVATGLLGACVVDDNKPGEILCVDDIVLDTYACVDASAAGAFICSFANADNTGSGAFGNSIGDAVAPGDCNGATLVAATGSIGGGQVTGVGQYHCPGGVEPTCRTRWSVAAFSSFTNGIEEFDRNGLRALTLIANDTSVAFILCEPMGIGNCQAVDQGMNLVYCNASQGGVNFTVPVSVTAPLSVASQKVATGNGKFVHHMWPGTPSGLTLTTLFDLGTACDNFLGGGAVVVENNVGRTNIVGASSYFGSAVQDPNPAPTFLASLTQPVVDTVNLPQGSLWTHQSVHVNAAASSAKRGSLSNALVMSMQ